MQRVLADLHVHTLLSPCAEIEMTPHHIVLRAAEHGIGALAITDHNASANISAALVVAEQYGVKVFPGMEVESSEEAHILALFDTPEQLESWQKIVDAHMNGRMNDTARFGAQLVVDEADEFISEEKRLLLAPLSLTAAQVVQQVAALGGMTIAAHVDRPAYSIVGQLGFIETGFGFAAAEISAIGYSRKVQSAMQRLTGYLPYVTNSDAHNIYDFVRGPKNLLMVEELTVAELGLALESLGGRSLLAGKFSEFYKE